jgi:hypothetical protein
MADLRFDPVSLCAEGPRLPAIKKWLTDVVWTRSRYNTTDPESYLRQGEEAVTHLEEMMATGALAVWDELEADSRESPTLKAWLGLDAPLPLKSPHAAVVFDGLSLRELPLLLKMAETTGFRVKSVGVAATSLPTETMDFVDQRVIGTRIGPSRLKGRREFAEKNVEAFYLEQPNAREVFPSGRSLLVWSSYPDRLFFNDEARSEQLFTTFHQDHIPVLWKCTVQAIPRGMPIVVTADHGYIFFGASLESTRDSDAAAQLGQARSKEFNSTETLPTWHPDLQILSATRTALLRGRLRAKPQGPASRKIYQHGGFSLMEVLVPWIELERI